MQDHTAVAPRFNIVDRKGFFTSIPKFIKDLPQDYIGTMRKVQKHHGDLVHLRAFGGMLNFAFISDPLVNRELFIRNTDALGKSASQIQTFQFAAGDSVATAHGDDWRVKRKEANALFSRQIVEALCEGQGESVTRFLKTQGKDHSGNALARRLSAFTSSRGILGRHITVDEADTQIAFSIAARDRFNAEVAHVFAKPHWMMAPWRRELTRQKQLVTPIIQAAMDELRGSDSGNDGLMNHYVNGDFITSTDEEMQTIMLGLLMGAQDNVAAASAWWLTLMAHHPDIQADIAAEVRQAGSDADSLNKCSLLRSSVFETLRLRPAAPANQPRNLTKPVEIVGHKLPKRCYVMNSVFNFHQNQNIFPDPEKFDPTRFLDGTLERSPHFAPFGHGPRNCVAQAMAVQQMRAIGAAILRDYRIETSDAALPAMEQLPFLTPASFQIRLQPR